jgi:hypothetical protein
MAGEYEEYEVIPTSPIRRLEQRISKMESTTSSAEVNRLVDQIIELIKSNQKVVDDVIKANADLRNELSRIPVKIDNLIGSMSEFLELLKTSATEETVGSISKEVMGPMVDKIAELVDHSKKNLEISQSTLATMDMIDKRLKRLYVQPPAAMYPARRPTAPAGPVPYEAERSV